ncbi:MAG: DUF3376 domain-containing protein, partial [Abditibacteriales bacterium]|nr:DUF3376 domain-containing protein [Abditibacteriales bacterium]MDW8368171.1 DUF3376 domain-containing protein [Abditibacteriales bacterium]
HLIDENNPNESRRKLAGTALFNFGAFLERLWRENDMMWGRLDAAERIITTLLPNHPDRCALLEEAQRAIVAEELRPRDRDEVLRLIGEVLAQVPPKDRNEQTLRQLVEQTSGTPVNLKLQAVLRHCLEEQHLLTYLREGYEVNRNLAPAKTLDALARSTLVFCKILVNLICKYCPDGKHVAWVIWVGRTLDWMGRLLWGLVKVAMLCRLLNLIGQYWLWLLYLFEVLLIGGGFVFNAKPILIFGLKCLAITLVVHAVVWLVGKIICRRRRGCLDCAVKVASVVVGFAVVALAVIGVGELIHLLKYGAPPEPTPLPSPHPASPLVRVYEWLRSLSK